jgi:CDP-glucose 4,6-dehydratase
MVLNFETALKGQRILVTGHSGFTGGWVVLWLEAIGCEVFGLALPPDTEPSLFSAARIAAHQHSEFGDIRDFTTVRNAMERAKPTVVLHLAAQPLVSQSFAQPIETMATNVLGTAHVLEAARLSPSVKAVVCVTTDKVYEDRESRQGYRETDRLGGKDPYSASKASAELVALCYRSSMVARGNGCRIATARGGNIIGGGDWSKDRIVPDFVRALVSSSALVVRRPDAVRPWQHVLALVHGYLLLAASLLEGRDGADDAWNFGPGEEDAVPVKLLIERLASAWARPEIKFVEPEFPETSHLRLDSSKARRALAWQPPLDLQAAVGLTAEWYRSYYAKPSSARDLTAAQIDRYRQQL